MINGNNDFLPPIFFTMIKKLSRTQMFLLKKLAPLMDEDLVRREVRSRIIKDGEVWTEEHQERLEEFLREIK